MLLGALNKMLRKILSLVFNCEKTRDRKNAGVEGETVERSDQSFGSVGTGSNRAKDEKDGGIPDPWWQNSEYY